MTIFQTVLQARMELGACRIIHSGLSFRFIKYFVNFQAAEFSEGNKEEIKEEIMQ